MKSFESFPPDTGIRRLVFARVVAGLIVLIAVVLAPPVPDSIATLNLSSAELEDLLDDGGELVTDPGIDVLDTTAAPIEPLSMSY